MAITLWRLATNTEYHSLSHLFGVGISTACVAVSDVCSAIMNHLARRYISIPAGEWLKLVVDGYPSGAFPNILVQLMQHLIAPKDSPVDY